MAVFASNKAMRAAAVAKAFLAFASEDEGRPAAAAVVVVVLWLWLVLLLALEFVVGWDLLDDVLGVCVFLAETATETGAETETEVGVGAVSDRLSPCPSPLVLP